MNWKKFVLRASVVLLALLVAAPPVAFSQSSKGSATFQQEQLDQMVAPIALYPDSLLAQILMASTYPLEIVQADRWVKKNGQLKGTALKNELDKMEWDASVKALVSFPQILAMMSEQLDWTQKLGDAFLAQQSDVMDAVQRLRGKAYAKKELKNTREQKVVVEEKVIRIEPADPQVVYVPVYDPVVVYGPWPYPASPPYYWPAYYGPPLYATGLAFAAGVAVGVAWSSGWGYWGWGNHTINVYPPHPPPPPHPPGPPGPKPPGPGPGPKPPGPAPPHPDATQWKHDPAHRKGVAYHDDATRQMYSQKPAGARSAGQDYRGHTSDGSAKPSAGTASRGSSLKDQGSRTPSADTARSGSDFSRTRDAASNTFKQDRGGAFEGLGHGSEVRANSDRGFMSHGGGAHFSGGRGGFRR